MRVGDKKYKIKIITVKTTIANIKIQVFFYFNESALRKIFNIFENSLSV